MAEKSSERPAKYQIHWTHQRPMRIRKFMMTLKLVSTSILLRFDCEKHPSQPGNRDKREMEERRLTGVSPPFNMIFVSPPVKTTSPMIHWLFLMVQPRSKSSLMPTGSKRSFQADPKDVLEVDLARPAAVVPADAETLIVSTSRLRDEVEEVAEEGCVRTASQTWKMRTRSHDEYLRRPLNG
jgi:hypothetical protein